MTKITDALKETNKWWKTEFKIDYKPRETYKDIKKFAETGQIIALIGLRRVGKTTILLKFVRDKLDEGIRPENIVYFSFDDFRDITLKEVLTEYAELMMKDLDSEKYIFLFDELQKIPGWEEQLKRLYDNYRNIRFLISGSESLFIRKQTRESLAGRFFEFKICPFSFKEFLGFKGIQIKNIELNSEELKKLFKEYAATNGFPEMFGQDNEIIKKYVKENIIEKIIYRDIPQIFPVKDPAALYSLFKIILSQPGAILNLDDLASELGMTRQTTSLYLDYLEKSFLIVKLYNYSKNQRTSEKKLKKYYPTIIPPDLFAKDDWAKILETIIVLQTKAQFFWRDARKNEVDIIDTRKGVRPIEIKSGKIDSKGLLAFMKKFKTNEALIITLNQESQQDNIKIVPAYKFLFSDQ